MSSSLNISMKDNNSAQKTQGEKKTIYFLYRETGIRPCWGIIRK